ncbi:MAG: tetratricopeptide repeat protein, partial [Sedimenticolaceae bacterium]
MDADVQTQEVDGVEGAAMTMIENLHGMLERGVDSALLRYSLGSEFLKIGRADAAIAHLREALKLDAEYSAAWKMLGKALATAGNHDEAVDVLNQGIAVAERRGDAQAAKEMGVFRKRSQ